jgi:hypothetical protein
MKKTVAILLVGLLASGAFAANMLFSMGTREVDPNGVNPPPLPGVDGGASGGIEWVNLDGQVMPFDGQWHQYSFNMVTDPLTPFAGATANGILQGVYGTLEHLRFNSNGFLHQVTLWIDDIACQYNPNGPLPPPVQNVTFGTFETDSAGVPYVPGTEVMFQEPEFSGSTNAYVDQTRPQYSAIDDTEFYSGTRSLKVTWHFMTNPANPSAMPWLRLTTFRPSTPQPQANPVIRYDEGIVTMWIKAIPEPSSLALLGLGALAVLRRR